jgi:flagellar biosynthesis protein FlhG
MMSVIPADQAAQLRLLMREGMSRAAAPAPMVTRVTARVIVVASGKGGVGKTNIAVNLAIALAQRSKRTVLVDADLGTANADVLLNVETAGDLSDVIAGRMRLGDVAVTLSDGLRLIPGASGMAGVADLSPIERRGLIDELTSLEASADFIVVDCGAGISQNVLAFARAAHELLIVTTPEPTALTDAYALVKVLSRASPVPSLGLVVNQADSRREADVVAARVAGVAARFLGVPLESRGHVLRDEQVARAVRRRTAFLRSFPTCAASGCITALAAGVDSPSRASGSQRGFFSRLLAFFY